jgi:hypothetical protein
MPWFCAMRENKTYVDRAGESTNEHEQEGLYTAYPGDCRGRLIGKNVKGVVCLVYTPSVDHTPGIAISARLIVHPKMSESGQIFRKIFPESLDVPCIEEQKETPYYLQPSS